MSARVESVSRAGEHGVSKLPAELIELIAGHGVAGDAHAGVTVKHRSRVAKDPTQPNLRQVHLIHAELFDAIAPLGHRVAPGELGENILTRGINLLALPADSELRIGESAVVRVTGLRNPCAQIEAFQSGLLAQMVEKRADGALVRKAGVMGIVLNGGRVRPGDSIEISLPEGPHRPLGPV
ncbi:MOSC domain-containing protein [Devosia nitrariae]|uniref:MOSC domain-containing protein n=1 Tax=Devosia nitrariae TaxID=2071872 RepID=A0ABQ5W853_9HYPH|nr:MOSC domain-containing protein [Devosia nitrariae]GLQ56252.1 MOSC domain-containing protein [Devosia nitrariae]